MLRSACQTLPCWLARPNSPHLITASPATPPAAGVPVPADAPFELTYLNARLPVAQEDELQQVGCRQLGLLGTVH